MLFDVNFYSVPIQLELKLEIHVYVSLNTVTILKCIEFLVQNSWTKTTPRSIVNYTKDKIQYHVVHLIQIQN